MQDLQPQNKEDKKPLTLWQLEFYPIFSPNLF